MNAGTPIVRGMPPRPPRGRPDGPPLFAGRPDVVDAWQRRARRQRAVARGVFLGMVALAAVGTAGEAFPFIVGIAIVGAAGVLYPLSLIITGARAAQRPVELFEEGVWINEVRWPLPFRRFVEWPDVVRAEARELLPGRFLLTLTAIDGTSLSSIPGEVPPEAVDEVNARTRGLIGTIRGAP